MTQYKSPQLHICGKISHIIDPKPESSQSFYVKVSVVEGEQWKLITGKKKFQSFETESTEAEKTYLEHPFELHYVTTSMRGWPRLLAEVWKVDEDGRHNIYGYGTMVVPFKNGEYKMEMPCWRPMGTWFDRFVGSNAELQYPGMMISSLNRYGLRTYAGCKVLIEINVIGRNFHLHGVLR